MAHRAVKAVNGESKTSIVGSLVSAVDRTPLAGKVVLSLEGGKHQDFEAAEAYLGTQNLPWQIILSDEITGYHQAVLRGLEKCAAPVVAIIPPWQEIVDDLWVQRMSWCLQRDMASLLCTTWEQEGPAKDLAPHVAQPRKWPGGRIILGRREDLTNIWRLIGPEDLYANLAEAAATGSWRIWAHPGIRFNSLEHETYEGQKTGAKPPQATASGSG
jgi:hypothetical protein